MNYQTNLINGCLNSLEESDYKPLAEEETEDPEKYDYCRNCAESNDCMDDDFESHDTTIYCPSFKTKIK